MYWSVKGDHRNGSGPLALPCGLCDQTLQQHTKQETATKITSATATCVSNVRGIMR